MSATDQPSILTVCVPDACADVDIAAVSEIFAARERSAAVPRMSTHGTTGDSRALEPECNRTGDKCDSCDDSACGMELSTGSLTGSSLHGSSGNGPSAGRPDSQIVVSRGLDSAGLDGGRLNVAQLNSAQSELAQLELSPGCKPSFFHADSGKKALELLRMLRFDLLVTGDQIPDMPVSQLIRRVRAAWPWQKWAMVGSMISPQDEIAARTLGAMAVFDAPPDWEVLGSLAAKAAGRADASASVRAETQKLAAVHCADGSGRRKPCQSPDAAASDRIGIDDGMGKRSVAQVAVAQVAVAQGTVVQGAMVQGIGRAKSPRRRSVVSPSLADRSATG